jgi:multicomponent Na+:H+ antiporter subunit F
MAEFLTLNGAFVLLTVLAGLVRLLRGPTIVDRISALQLVGSGGTVALVLLSFGLETPAYMDVALIMAILATFASAAATLKIAPPLPPLEADRAER